nr:DUF2971 domain-containing protein [uncultured Carboxylicivirga sp.]
MEKEIIINSKYKYVFDSDLNRMHIHKDNKPFPLRPEKLFKFFDTNLLSIASLHENYFWLSNPKDFNDPFDCNSNLVEFESKEYREKYYSQKGNRISDYGVTCFTEEINEPLMWAHYANNYFGFALEVNTEHIQVNLAPSNRKKSLNPVLYFNNFIKVKNTAPFAKEYFLTAKSANWKYEKEWRIITQVDDEIKYNRIAFYKPITIKAIYIGHRLFDENETVFNLIESIFATKYPDKPMYIVYPHPDKLELNFQRRHIDGY